jgi:threonine dehydrogenase-like Zn-dependent dehydrogenase
MVHICYMPDFAVNLPSINLAHQVWAVDSVPERLALAAALGAEPLDLKQQQQEGVTATIREQTEGRCACRNNGVLKCTQYTPSKPSTFVLFGCDLRFLSIAIYRYTGTTVWYTVHTVYGIRNIQWSRCGSFLEYGSLALAICVSGAQCA